MLYVLETIPGYVATKFRRAYSWSKKRNAEQAVREVAARHKVSDVVIREGAPATEILEHASKIGADLIVLYAHDPDVSNYLSAPSPAGSLDMHIAPDTFYANTNTCRTHLYLDLADGAAVHEVAGDGQPDLVMLDGPTPGLYEHYRVVEINVRRCRVAGSRVAAATPQRDPGLHRTVSVTTP